MKKYLIFFLLFFFTFTLSACGRKKPSPVTTPTPASRLIELSVEDRPSLKLSSRDDGHELTLSLSSILPKITQIEYELTYVATDNNLQIEKGANGLIEAKDITAGSAQRKILLGTESCTNGCKYKYDSGVTGGHLLLTFTLSGNQVAIYETDFILRSATEIKKAGQINWSEQNYSFTPKSIPAGTFFVVFKDYKSGDFQVTNSRQ